MARKAHRVIWWAVCQRYWRIRLTKGARALHPIQPPKYMSTYEAARPPGADAAERRWDCDKKEKMWPGCSP